MRAHRIHLLAMATISTAACTVDTPARPGPEAVEESALEEAAVPDTRDLDRSPGGAAQVAPSEAPTGFDGLTNGLVDQGTMDAAQVIFAAQEDVDEGLGPVFNASSCGECHQNPTSGGSSQISELRAGHFNGAQFVDHPGGSLINDRAIDAAIQERVLAGNEVRAFRMSNSVLGAGFVEAIDSNTLAAIARNQPARLRGEVILVSVDEVAGAQRVGRFGWKSQHASLLSFAADAYLNEMGITSPLQPVENTSLGRSVAAFDQVADPEDNGEDVEQFALFMRSTKAPPVDAVIAATAESQRGSAVFDRIGCATCHVRTIVTAPAGTTINGGALVVTPELGDKIIHPFSDFLLHNVGTGDGIVQNGGASTRNKLRTAPLWGLRTRDRLMHDGLSLTPREAILRHAGQAAAVTDRLRLLSSGEKEDLLTFLSGL